MASARGGQGYDDDDERAPLLASRPNVRAGAKSDYDIVTQIGMGGFGMVYHVKEKSTGRDLALKECSKHALKQKRMEHLIMRERIAHAKMHHKNIIALLKAFQDKDALYFVMDLMKSTLNHEFGMRGVLRNESTRFYTAEIILALEYLQKIRVVHNDLKMANVLLDQRMHAKLCDFGCAVFVEDKNPNVSRRQQWRQSRPNLHHRVGTPCYFAPEVVTKGPVHLGTDLWMLGCMLCEMHTGQKPFEPWEDLGKLIPACEYQEFPHDCDPSLKHLCEQLLVKDPERRLGYKDMNKLKMHPFYGTRDPASWEQLYNVDPPPFSSRDPRARAEETDRPMYDIFFKPETDQMPVYSEPDQSVYEDFDSTASEIEEGLCSNICPPSCTIL